MFARCRGKHPVEFEYKIQFNVRTSSVVNTSMCSVIPRKFYESVHWVEFYTIRDFFLQNFFHFKGMDFNNNIPVECRGLNLIFASIPIDVQFFQQKHLYLLE